MRIHSVGSALNHKVHNMKNNSGENTDTSPANSNNVTFKSLYPDNSYEKMLFKTFLKAGLLAVTAMIVSLFIPKKDEANHNSDEIKK